MPLTRLRLGAPRREGDGLRFADELQGLIVLGMEVGAADLPGVVVERPGPEGAALAQGLRLTPERTLEVRLRLQAQGAERARLVQESCWVPAPATAPCVTTEVDLAREAPWPAMATLLEALSRQLGVPEDAARAEGWRTPGSPDTYAELITGRAAAASLGMLADPPAPLEEDDTSPPEVTLAVRAVRIDPAQPLAQWLLARAELSRAAPAASGSLPEADLPAPDAQQDPVEKERERRRTRLLTAARRASELRPGSPWLAAFLARVEAASGRPLEALAAWQEAERRAGTDDPRFGAVIGEALLALGRAQDAESRGSALLERFPRDPAVARLRVRAGERLALPDLDARLEAWQRLDPRAVEPVRRRVDARVAAGAWEEALGFLPALRARGATGMDSVETAILAGMGRWEAAATRAPLETARALRYREAALHAPGTGPAELPADDPRVQLARGEAALARGENAAAAARAEEILASDDRSAAAWALRARARDALGRARDATEDWIRAWERDPALDGGPVQAGRVASTFRFVEQGAPPAAPAQAATRAKRRPGPQP